MIRSNLRVGDYGTTIRVRVVEAGYAVDVGDPSSVRFALRKPNGTVVTVDATLTGTGADGKVEYVVEEDVLDQAGDWQLQAEVTIMTQPAGEPPPEPVLVGVFFSTIETFRVDAAIEFAAPTP